MLDTGLEIRILRERLKMSAKDLAERVGLSQSQMSRLEKGQRRIDMKVLERIAQALDVSPSYFFRGGPTPAAGVIPPTIPEAIGRLVRSERHRRHFSAEDLARKVGRPKAAIESIEEGKRELDPELADRILKALRLPSNYFLAAQQKLIRGLEAQVGRLNEALAEVTRGSLALRPGTGEVEGEETGEESGSRGGGPDGSRGGRRGVPILGTLAQGYPQTFDASGRPIADVSDFVFLPDLPQGGEFALHVVGDSMVGESAPSFREGDLAVFGGGTPRSRDFCFVQVEGEEATFRQLFFDAQGQIRLQPLNLNVPARVHPRERILATWRLVAHIARF